MNSTGLSNPRLVSSASVDSKTYPPTGHAPRVLYKVSIAQASVVRGWRIRTLWIPLPATRRVGGPFMVHPTSFDVIVAPSFQRTSDTEKGVSNVSVWDERPVFVWTRAAHP